MIEHRSSSLCAIVEQPVHHCGDHLVLMCDLIRVLAGDILVNSKMKPAKGSCRLFIPAIFRQNALRRCALM